MLDPRGRIVKARVKLTKHYPFFGYLSMYLKPKETTEIDTMAVDIDGNLLYNPEFVKKLSDEELVGVICHEILHIVFEHLIRGARKNRKIYNIASDTVINANLTKQGLTLPNNVILPNWNDVVELRFITDKGNITIKIEKASEKSADEVYDVIMANLGDKVGSGTLSKSSGEQFDTHKYAQSSNGKGKSKNKVSEKAQQWAKRFQEALEYARQRGNLPAGFERLFDKIHGNYLNWRQLLYRYITRTIPIDFTYARPSKKSYALKTYFPNIIRESLNVVVAIDTSGSISQQELTDALSEVCGIVNQYRGVKLTIIYADYDVQKVIELQHPTVDDILREKPRGGGGTSHKPVFKYIEKNCRNAQLVIAFSDLWTEFPESCSIPTLWINFDPRNTTKPPFGTVINYEREKR